MGDLMRSVDWSETPVGPVDQWPASLKTTLRMLLNSKFGMFLWWGPDLVQFYNDAYRPSFGKAGEKHPKAMGQRGKECWGEIWSIIYPQIEQVMTQGVATLNENQLVPIYRNNLLEEVYWTYTYSPVFVESGDVGGVLVIETETSRQVIGERRTTLLRDLAVSLNSASNVKEVCRQAMQVLANGSHDIPFALIYLLSPDGSSLDLAGSAGLSHTHPALLAKVKADNPAAEGWRLWETIHARQPLEMHKLDKRFGRLPGGPWPEDTKTAYLLPLVPNDQSNPVGVLVTGASPRGVWDNEYKSFLDSVGRQISSGIVTARAYEDEKKQVEALAEIDRAKTLFFSNVSHEFRTPLTLILGPLQEWLRNPKHDTSREQIEMMHRNGLRLQKLVNTLLDFSRIEAGRIEAAYVPVDLASYTADLASNFRSAIEKAGMQLKINIQPLSEPVYVDTDMWEKIVLNLLSNALKYTFAGEIEVKLTEHTGEVQLLVRDTGEGIPEKDLPIIFERFKRVEGARTRTYEGSGIGLSLVQELVKLHRGTVTVKSTEGEGTSFFITLSKGKAHLPADQIKQGGAPKTKSLERRAFIEEIEQWLQKEGGGPGIEKRPPLPAGDKPKIVLADDNTDMRKYIRRLLSEHFEVIAAPNGKEALNAVLRDTPDLVLTDVMMPEMDGYSRLAILKNNPRTARIPVVVLSARAGEEARVEGLEAGADDYLTKPFGANELVARVSSLILASKTRYETENRLYELFMQAPALIAVLRGPMHVFELANPPYMQIVGTERNIIGKPIRNALPEVATQGIIQILDSVYESGVPYYGNELLVKLDPTGKGDLQDVYFNFVYQPIKNSLQQVEGILVHAVDVTEQVQVRKAITDSEEKYRGLFESMNQGFCIFEVLFDDKNEPVDYIYLEANPVFESHTGLKNVVGQRVTELVPNLERHWFEIYGKVATTGESTHFEHGSEVMGRWFEVYAFRIGGVESRKVALLFTDITERKKTEQKLQYHATLTEHIADAVIATDLQYNIVSWNKSAETLYGWKQEEVLGRSAKEIVPTTFINGNQSTDWQKGLATEGYWTGEILQKRKDQTSIPIHCSVTYVLDANEKPIGAVAVNRDITERKEAEKALQKTEEKYRRLFNSIDEGFCIIEVLFDNSKKPIDYRFVEVNDAFKKQTDITDAKGKTMREIAPRHEEFWFKMYGEIAATGESKRFVSYASQFHRYYDVYAFPAGEGLDNHVAVLFNDVTKRQLAEEALKQSEEYYKTMTDNTPVMTWNTQPDGTCTYLNKQWYDYTGQTPESGLGFGWLKAVHPRDLKKTEQITKVAYEREAPFSLEYRLKGNDGSYRWHLDTGLPKFGNTGVFEGHVGAVIDIHERKTAEEKLRESEEFNRTLLESSPDCVNALDLNGAIISVNNNGRRMMEIENFGDLKGKLWTKLWEGDYFRAAVAAVEKAKNGGIGHMLGYRTTAKGTPKWWDVLVAPVKDTTGAVERLVCVSRDITTLKELEKQKDEFIGIASHELKTPVTSIKGSIQIIDRLFQEKSYEMVDNFLKKADLHVNKLTALINDLLDISKIQAGKLEYNFTDFIAREIITDAVEQVSHQKKNHKITVLGNLDATVYGDKARLEQVVTNLLTNAIKYSPHATEVILNAESDGGSLTVSVTDFGIGIPGEKLSNIFDRFFRVEKSSHQFQGLGLGLFICAEIVKRHGGEITAKSTEGVGSTFSFTIPIKQAAA